MSSTHHIFISELDPVDTSMVSAPSGLMSKMSTVIRILRMYNVRNSITRIYRESNPT